MGSCSTTKEDRLGLVECTNQGRDAIVPFARDKGCESRIPKHLRQDKAIVQLAWGAKQGFATHNMARLGKQTGETIEPML